MQIKCVQINKFQMTILPSYESELNQELTWSLLPPRLTAFSTRAAYHCAAGAAMRELLMRSRMSWRRVDICRLSASSDRLAVLNVSFSYKQYDEESVVWAFYCQCMSIEDYHRQIVCLKSETKNPFPFRCCLFGHAREGLSTKHILGCSFGIWNVTTCECFCLSRSEQQKQVANLEPLSILNHFNTLDRT